jgi:hypothetical protein
MPKNPTDWRQAAYAKRTTSPPTALGNAAPYKHLKQHRLTSRAWIWNPFWGFFFQPVGPHRQKERIVKEGALFNRLYAAAGYP